jgi:hypothetical protein
VDILKAWAVYYPLKCAVVLWAMFIGERLGFLVLSVEKGPALKEGVEMGWSVLAVYYAAVAVVAAFLFRWTVSRFVVSKMAKEDARRLSLFRYCKAWVVYAAVTFALGHLIVAVFEYTIFELVLGSMAEAPWPGWLCRAVRPLAFTSVSLLVFRWTVIKLLLVDRTARFASKAEVM